MQLKIHKKVTSDSKTYINESNGSCINTLWTTESVGKSFLVEEVGVVFAGNDEYVANLFHTLSVKDFELWGVREETPFSLKSKKGDEIRPFKYHINYN